MHAHTHTYGERDRWTDRQRQIHIITGTPPICIIIKKTWTYGTAHREPCSLFASCRKPLCWKTMLSPPHTVKCPLAGHWPLGLLCLSWDLRDALQWKSSTPSCRRLQYESLTHVISSNSTTLKVSWVKGQLLAAATIIFKPLSTTIHLRSPPVTSPN